jgi:hypothetical protein
MLVKGAPSIFYAQGVGDGYDVKIAIALRFKDIS